MNRLLQIIVVFIMSTAIFAICYSDVTITEGVIDCSMGETVDTSKSRNVVKIATVYRPKEEKTNLSEDDVRLLALVTMAEAEGECEEGKRLVIDTILNRIDSPYFPDTVYEVVYQKNQFSSMWNGRVERCVVKEEICILVKEEMENRSNCEVIFFTAGHYGNYGTPMFSVGNHYFSSY